MLSRILIVLLIFINYSPNDELVIEWNTSKRLAWSDFKAPVDYNSDAVAVTASGITFSFSLRESNGKYVSFNASAKAHFYPEKSWYNSKEANDHILAHEQLHFDITELSVRKLRYAVSKLQVSQNIKHELRQLHNEANEALAKMQEDYDMQTDHSRNKEAQILWSKFVEEELKKVSAYSSR